MTDNVRMYNNLLIINKKKHNHFNSINLCFENSQYCLLGIFFPYCLFGIIYKKSGFGSFFMGSIKYFLLLFLLSLFYYIIIYDIRWTNIFGPLNNQQRNINMCRYDENCSVFYNNSKLIQPLNQKNLLNNNCIIPQDLKKCKCLEQSLLEYCTFSYNLPVTKQNTDSEIIIFSSIWGIISCSSIGVFLGYYRNRISDNYNIKTSFFKNFLLHCIPFINPCALCQEANTIDRINEKNIITPCYAV